MNEYLSTIEKYDTLKDKLITKKEYEKIKDKYCLPGNMNEKSEILIYNLQGEKIYAEVIYNSKKKFIKEIDLNIYPKGIYFVKIKNNKFVKVEKVVLQ